MAVKRLLVATLVTISSGLAAQTPAPAATWRLDLFHTGGPSGLEVFALDRVVVEQPTWTGPVGALADTSHPGAYRLEVRDTTGRLLYTRGYATVYQEWITTAERRKRNRTFHESLRFPEPRSVVDVIISRRDPRNVFAEVWRTRVDPRDPLIDRAERPRAPAIAIERNGDPARKVDILLVGDGYTAAECARKFGPDTRRMARALFAEQPFTARRSDFNVWGVCPPSPVSGISRPSTGTHVASPLGTSYDAFGAERYILTYENRAVREIAAAAPYDFIVILVNGATYGGGGIFNNYTTVAVDSDWADYLFIHELGHSFAGLADEYYTSPDIYEAPAEITEPAEPNVTALRDPVRLKWADLRTKGVPVPTPWPKEEFEKIELEIQKRRAQIRAAKRPESEMTALFREEQRRTSQLFAKSPHAHHVGAFQGANYDAKAFYRSEIDCIMFTRNDVGFCAVCRRALSAVIDLFTGRREG